jgi:hypothetical protein
MAKKSNKPDKENNSKHEEKGKHLKSTVNEKNTNPESTGPSSKAVLAVVVIVVFLAALGAAYFITRSGSGSGFSSFVSAFHSAPRVAIAVTAYNSIEFSYTIACGTSVIERIVGSKQYHRNETTIDFFVINSTSCLVPNAALGSATGAVNENISNCMSRINSEPSIYINYSASGNLTRIKGTSLYTSGDATFLSECGIAQELG